LEDADDDAARSVAAVAFEVELAIEGLIEQGPEEKRV